MKKKVVIGYTFPHKINDFRMSRYLNREGWISLELRKTNLYFNSIKSISKKPVWEIEKRFKKYKVTIERIKK